MDLSKYLHKAFGMILIIVLLTGCNPTVASPNPVVAPLQPTNTFLPPPPSAQSPQPVESPAIFTFIRTVQVTPDDTFLTGSFPRINFVPGTGHFVVTFGTKATAQKGEPCEGAGYAYKEYSTDMQEIGTAGRLIWYPQSCEAGDSGAVMVENFLFYAFVPQESGQVYGWHIVKYDAVNWTILAETNFSLTEPNEAALDPTVAFVNGQLDISDQYNPDGIWQEGEASHHNFFSLVLMPLGKRILDDTPHISGASMIFVDGVYYIISADSYSGGLRVIRYDQDWNYLGVKDLILQAHWSQGVAFDGQRFYVAYLDTSLRTSETFFPVYPNVHLAAFDRDWNLLEDVAVTNFVLSDLKKGGRPWVIFFNNRLYVSYDVDTVDPVTLEEDLKWQAYVSIYEVAQGH